MKVNLKQIINDRAGKPCKHGGEDATLGLLSYAALDNITGHDGQISIEEKMRRGRLAQRIVASDGEIDLKPEDVAVIKKCIGNSFGPWVIAQTEDMWESEPKLSAVKQGD